MMSSRNVIITAVLTSILTTICVYFGLELIKGARSKKREGQVEVPLILGLPHAQADNVLRQTGLKLQVLERRPDANFQRDQICEQVPPKGAKLPVGAVVTAVISEGQPKITVPQVVGIALPQARAMLERANFKLGRVTTAPHPSIPKDHISACSPLPGTTQKLGARVDLTVSAGPDDAEVPKVTGIYYGSAKKKIIQAGFVVGKVKWRDNEDYDDYVVISQDPKAGTRGPKGSKVDITVNKGD